MNKYLLVALLTITFALTGCDDDDESSSSSPKINGWGTPPTVETPTTTDEAAEMLSLSAQVSNEFMSKLRTLRETMEADPAIQQAVDDLKNNPDVVAVTYQDKSLYIYTRLGDKVIVLLDSEYRNNPTTSNDVTTLSTNHVDAPSHSLAAAAGAAVTNKRLASLNEFNGGISNRSDGLFTTQSVHPSAGGRKALILSGYQTDFSEDLCPIKEAFENGGFLVDFVVDKEMCGVPATTFDNRIINYVTQLHQYDVVYFNTHGNSNALSLGIPYDSDNPSPQLLSFKLNPGVHLSASSKKLMIDSTYISHTFKDAKKLKNALVFTDSCLSGKVKNHLADAFLDSGAAVYVGYNNTTQYNRQTPQFSSPFFQRLNQVGFSVTKALKEPTVLPTHWTSETEQDCTLFLFGCQTVETEGVDLTVYQSQTVQNDPEGFIPVPFVYAITNISRNMIHAGDTMTIQGRHFDSESQNVYLYHRRTASKESLIITSFTNNQIEVIIPESVAPRSYELYIGDYILHSNANAAGYSLTVQEEGLINPGTVQGSIKDAVNGNPLSGVLITVRRPDNTFVSERSTDINGKYDIALSEGSYVLEMSLEGYISATVSIEITRDQITTIPELSQVPQAKSGSGVITGKLVDSVNQREVNNATLNIRYGINATTGEIIATAITDNNGNYRIDLPAGNYTIEALVNAYFSTYFTIVAIGQQTTNTSNTAITPKEVKDSVSVDFTGSFNFTDPNRTYQQYHGFVILSADGTGRTKEFINNQLLKALNADSEGYAPLYWHYDEKTQTFTLDWSLDGQVTAGYFDGQVEGNLTKFTLSGHWNNGSSGRLTLERQ